MRRVRQRQKKSTLLATQMYENDTKRIVYSLYFCLYTHTHRKILTQRWTRNELISRCKRYSLVERKIGDHRTEKEKNKEKRREREKIKHKTKLAKRIRAQIIVVNIERTPAKRYRYASIHAHIKSKWTPLVFMKCLSMSFELSYIHRGRDFPQRSHRHKYITESTIWHFNHSGIRCRSVDPTRFCFDAKREIESEQESRWTESRYTYRFGGETGKSIALNDEERHSVRIRMYVLDRVCVCWAFIFQI